MPPISSSRLIRLARRLALETGGDLDELLAAAAKVSEANPKLTPDGVVALLRAAAPSGKHPRRIPDGPPNR